MTVKIVTDSSSDLPPQLVKELGITVVPLYVRFGDKVYRDRVDITEDEFYRRLTNDTVHPSTIQPSPQDFVDAYQKVCKGADGILSIHISSKLSGTYSSAVQAVEFIDQCPVEVMDSRVLTVALGIPVVAAARAALAGETLEQIMAKVERMMPTVHLLGLLDTLRYVLLGGRIGKAKALLGSMLNVKPVLTLRDGEVMPAGQVRSRTKGIDRLVDYVRSASADLEEVAIAYNTTPEEAEKLAERVGTFFKGPLMVTRIGPLLGVHMGPGALVVAFRGKAVS